MIVTLAEADDRILVVSPHIRSVLYDAIHDEIARMQKRAAKMLPRAIQRRQVEADIARLRAIADELAR